MKKTHLVIFGPPGAGKGTFSQRIKKILHNLVHISTGDIFRENIKDGTELGKKIKHYMDEGKLVPDKITNAVLKNKLEDVSDKSWILDGYPRNLEQCKYLDSITEVDKALYLELSQERIKKRVLGRFKCPQCGNIYNKWTLPPKEKIGENKWICDKCGAKMEFNQRNDDTEETLEKRLDIYEKNITPIINYYNNKDKLKKIDARKTLKFSDEKVIDIVT
ncbi:MAG: nucleoside monophosphate kinase [Promethearchaeia archaeon]